MPVIHTHCPRVTSPCRQLPAFSPGQKSVFCELCQTRVHNLSAMSARERAALAGTGPLCVRYVRWLPAAALLLASQGALTQDDASADQMERVVVTGGGTRGATEPVFLASEVEDDVWMDPEPAPEE